MILKKEKGAAWMQRILTNPGELAWIILCDHAAAGLLRLSEQAADTWEIDVLVDQSRRRHGIAKAAVHLLRWIVRGHAIIAVVHEENHASQRLVEACGFSRTPISETGGKYQHFLI